MNLTFYNKLCSIAYIFIDIFILYLASKENDKIIKLKCQSKQKLTQFN
jgi:hypothetical protein